MSTLDLLYLLMGVVLACVSAFTALDRHHTQRLKATAFWSINAVLFLAGSQLPPFACGVLVIIMVALVATRGGIGRSQRPKVDRTRRDARAAQLKGRLFLPMLVVPPITLAGTALFKISAAKGYPLIDPHHATLAALALGIGVAFIVSLYVLRVRPAQVMREGTQLYDTIGWTLILPQMLAALGAIFAKAGVGAPIAQLVQQMLPLAHPQVAVLTYGLGMALLAFIMGNALAAFPIMTVGVGLPFIVIQSGGDPTVMASLGMLCGFCGGLMSPMAANFNTLPATLLQLSSRHAVIRLQWPTALIMLGVNLGLMMLLVYR